MLQVKLMEDLLMAAFQTDSTRVVTSTGRMPDTLEVGNRILGKGQLIVPRLEKVVPFPQDPKAANGFDNRGDLLWLTPPLMESFPELAGSIVNSPNFGPQACGIWKSTFKAPPASEPADQAVAARLRPFLTRLSFFLWSSGPDDELLSAAASGALRNPDVLAARADRMMNSRRMKRFRDAFGVQWLKVEHLTSSEPDKKQFPDFHTFGIVSHAKRGSVHMMIEPLLLCESLLALRAVDLHIAWNRISKAGRGTPLANLWVAQARAVGVEIASNSNSDVAEQFWPPWLNAECTEAVALLPR